MLKSTSLDLQKERLDRRTTERTKENINLLQEMLIDDPRISARENGLDYEDYIYIFI